MVSSAEIDGIWVNPWAFYRHGCGVSPEPSSTVGSNFTDPEYRFLTLVLASSQLSFYFVTGSEIRWDAATSVGNDPAGRKLMLSGLKAFLVAATMLLMASFLCNSIIWTVFHSWLSDIFIVPSAGNGDEEQLLETKQHVFRKNRMVRIWSTYGFQRWTDVYPRIRYNESGINVTAEQSAPQKNYYSPINDPLRITNLDQKLIEPLTQALKDHDVPITHVVLVMMESARKDIFPFKSGSHLHNEIISSYKTKTADVIQQLNARLSQLTPIAEKLTGESGNFHARENTSVSSLWEDTAGPGMGGLNVNGITTGSSLSFKSAVVNHCGVGPLPVDFMDEVKSEIYQPCLMQVLELFNQLKEKATPTTTGSHPSKTNMSNIQDRKWNSVFVQSITGLYDDQNILNENMGFKDAIYREGIGHPGAKYYHQDMEPINYFGFSEREIYPYLQDVVKDAIKKNQRLFLSHFTSTTHHPWATPKDFEDEQYFASESLMGKHEDMNSYLNSVRYVDTWLGDMLKILDDTGIANETLVVFAFQEDSPVTGCYENGHISNFRVPLVFRHPLLPKLQIIANATSISIVPTILDLLVHTKSLNANDSAVALDLMNEYEGQSLIRPYQAKHNGRQAWNFGIISAGGEMLSVGSAAVPYRLILPLTPDFEYIFSDLDTDPDEMHTVRGWSVDGLISRVQGKHGPQAGQWVAEAAKVGKWWVAERKRLWNYHGS
ncbi:hypothetical protein N7462_008536 [Penicillium macrosclerotiorum]|uniref:uncharacterized protein n=1 Tax=Penicillium macrosclerotiorum TaxID=303699 RepID=UPI0025495BA4|nr:uncharacterized protein N7462_008536 [Penicillium macrosclerotiorum]KAJ5675639.1 hypothetical protein N7462_008536 [Penicillium macrosclerotiorum]